MSGMHENFVRDQGQENSVAKRWYQDFTGVPASDEVSPAYLQWQGDAIARSNRSAYRLAAGWAYMEAALTSGESPYSDRKPIISHALGQWRAASAAKDGEHIADRSDLAIAHHPTFHFIASAIANGSFALPAHEEQEELFQGYATTLLERWTPQDDGGLTFEFLSSYFMHRSNKWRPQEPAILSLLSSVRNDHHPDPGRRVDVDYYNSGTGDVYGVQVKSGRLKQLPAETPGEQRIMLLGAKKLLCLPYTKHRLRATLRAIASDTPAYRRDLDIISIQLREKIQKHLKSDVAYRRINLQHNQEI